MKRKIIILVALPVLLLALLPSFAEASNPSVNITVRAKLVSITNSQDTWAIGVIAANTTAKWGASDTYSTVANTGNVNVNVEIRGTNLINGRTWTLAADGNAGNEIYGLKATITTTYDILVKPSAYVNLVANLPHTTSNTETWSMTFYAPTDFHVDETGAQKSATVTLVASEA